MFRQGANGGLNLGRGGERLASQFSKPGQPVTADFWSNPGSAKPRLGPAAARNSAQASASLRWINVEARPCCDQARRVGPADLREIA